ncbi:MAG: KEOPS complex kinase/ATPase Bud32 [Candidatus Nitrosocaldaceae archaeon]
MLIKRGAEAEIRLIDWYGKKAISKLRISKPYRNKILDESIRKHRTIHEAYMLHIAKNAGVSTPCIYFLDPINSEIIMEYIDGIIVKDMIDKDIELSREMGKIVGKLHKNDIIHGDLTTSNFLIKNDKLVLIDFGLSFKSKRIEDKAVDIRLVKEILSSAHVDIFEKALRLFLDGYNSVYEIDKILEKVKKIEMRGRYARVI